MIRSDSHSHDLWLSRVEALACVLLSLIFILRSGLPLGVGNQSLQMVWMAHLRDPLLFAADDVVQSFRSFPSWFFPVLAQLIPDNMPLGAALQILQVLNTVLLFLGVAVLTRSVFPGMRWVLLPLVFLLTGPYQALAETPLPPPAFTHTSFGLMLSCWTLAWCFRKKYGPAFMCLALIANVHLLTAAYSAAIMGVFLLFEWKSLPWKRLFCWIGLCAALCLPVLWLIANSHAVFDAPWLDLLRERSAHHVFPFSWWRKGDLAWGNFLLWSGWLVWAMTLLPKGSNLTATKAMILAPVALMCIGLLGSEIYPVPLILRAQLFRASIYLLLLTFMMLPVAFEHYREGSRTASWLALLSLAVFSVAVWDRFLPLLLVAVSLGAWWRGILRPWHAMWIGGVFCVLTASDLYLQTTFWRPSLRPLPDLSLLRIPLTEMPDDSWQQMQRLTRLHTPVQARILTPVRRSGFRTHSQRSIVGEWRDGTMQFFDPAFAAGWAKRMTLLSPENLRHARADDWVTLGAACRADYVVLPREEAQGLVWVAENEDWVLAETRLTPPPPLPPAPENAIDPGDWLAQERFMLEVVDANIEKYRKGRVTLRLLDAGGVALAGLPVEIDQMSLDFGIGSALHHFEPVVEVEKQYRASINHPLELERFKEVFNYSVMGYSGKWMYLEPEPDQRDYRDLDAYVAWCEQNGIRIEYHFVTGYAPKWMEKLPRAEQRSRLLAHAKDLIDRYGDRIDQWQVINERRMQNEAPEVFALFRAELPDAELGVSDCARFYSPRKGDQARKDLQRGMESMLQITKAGQAVDFFAIHAHRPEGTWGDPRTMYEVMDAFAEKGARIHISETGINHAGKIDGEVLRGEWNDELQAEYMVRFMKVAFSHPAVDVVNFWGFGPRTWQRHIGLLDENYEPRPAFLALKKLVRETWHTRLETRSGSAGDVRLHGFHGGYRVTVSHPDGRIGEGEFHLGADSPEALTVRVIWTDPHL
jgi:endo-1,4-beta-xylanase